MKNIKKLLSVVILACFCLSILPTNQADAATASLNITEVYVNMGSKVKVPAAGTFTWKSTDTKIATVNSKGEIKGIKSDNVVLSATSGGKTSHLSTIVIPSKKPVTSIKPSAKEKTMKVGEVISFSYTAAPKDNTDVIQVYSDSSSVDVKVSDYSDGLIITAKAVGTAKITIFSSSGKTASFSVTVAANKEDTVTQLGVKIPVLKKAKKLGTVEVSKIILTDIENGWVSGSMLVKNNNSYPIDIPSYVLIGCYDKNKKSIDTVYAYITYTPGKATFTADYNNAYFTLPAGTVSITLEEGEITPIKNFKMISGTKQVLKTKVPAVNTKVGDLTLTSVVGNGDSIDMTFKNTSNKALVGELPFGLVVYDSTGAVSYVVFPYTQYLVHLLKGESILIKLYPETGGRIEIHYNTSADAALQKSFYENFATATAAFHKIQLPKVNTIFKADDPYASEDESSETSIEITGYEVRTTRDASTYWYYRTELIATVKNVGKTDISYAYIPFKAYDAKGAVVEADRWTSFGVEAGETAEVILYNNWTFLKSEKPELPAKMVFGYTFAY